MEENDAEEHENFDEFIYVHANRSFFVAEDEELHPLSSIEEPPSPISSEEMLNVNPLPVPSVITVNTTFSNNDQYSESTSHRPQMVQYHMQPRHILQKKKESSSSATWAASLLMASTCAIGWLLFKYRHHVTPLTTKILKWF